MIYAYRYTMVVIYTLFWGTLGPLLALFDRSGDVVMWVGRNWIRWIMATCGIKIVTEGLENVDREKPQLFMCNHQSGVDIAALVMTLPVDWRFVAKRELSWIPFFGWTMALGRHILIDRGNRARAIVSLRKAAERIAGGTNVIFFPEGTRSVSGQLAPFKSGGFHLAIQAQVPVVPVTVSGTQRITPKGSLRVESGTVKILYGKPIPTAGRTIADRAELMEETRRAILAGFDPAYQDAAPPHPAEQSVAG